MAYNNRRSNNDRRRGISNISFPLRCSNNVIILNDRRIRCERRIQNLEVSESVISQEQFLDIFKCSNVNKGINSASSQDNKDVDIFDNCLISD